MFSDKYPDFEDHQRCASIAAQILSKHKRHADKVDISWDQQLVRVTDDVATVTARRTTTLSAVLWKGCWLMPDWEDSSTPAQAHPLRRTLTLKSIALACWLQGRTGTLQASIARERVEVRIYPTFVGYECEAVSLF